MPTVNTLLYVSVSYGDQDKLGNQMKCMGPHILYMLKENDNNAFKKVKVRIYRTWCAF